MDEHGVVRPGEGPTARTRYEVRVTASLIHADYGNITVERPSAGIRTPRTRGWGKSRQQRVNAIAHGACLVSVGPRTGVCVRRTRKIRDSIVGIGPRLRSEE